MAKKKATKSNGELSVAPAALIAEFIGTFSLAFAVLASINGVLATQVATPVIAGFTLALAVLSIGGISGAHINPAVTIGLLSVGKTNITNAMAYIAAQVVGALAAFGAMTLLLDGEVALVEAAVSNWRVFAAEALGAAIFTFGIASAVDQGLQKISAAVLVGGSLFLGIVFAATISNGVLNPAVALTISSASAAYIIGPVVGSVVGMNIQRWMRDHE